MLSKHGVNEHKVDDLRETMRGIVEKKDTKSKEQPNIKQTINLDINALSQKQHESPALLYGIEL